MKNSQISFKSNIEIVSAKNFNNVLQQCKGNFVGQPWTYKEIIRAGRGYTRRIEACTAGGIVVKNRAGENNVILFHLCPPEEDTLENSNFEDIEKAFLEKIGVDTPIEGLIIGANNHYKYSIEFFERVEKFFNKLKIAYSKFKTQNYGDYADIAYEGKPDKWTIYSSGVEKNGNLSSVFRGFSICDKDNFKLGIDFNYIV